MAIQVQLRRGTATQNNAFTGAIGELSFDTTNNQIRVHDGSTAGGFKIGTGDFPTGTANVALGNTALDSLDGSSPGGNNVAVGHNALTANTTPTALPDLSATDLKIAQNYMGTVGTFRVWDKDLGDDGIVEATNPSLEPSLSLDFIGTGTTSFTVSDWSE